jgi:nitronate monooxygenase
VPLAITSLGAREDVYKAFRDVGCLVLHDVINVAFARKTIEKGAGGLVAVCSGAGGHAGRLSPFALVQEIREWYDGPLALSGAIANGRSILAAEAMGADFAYAGSMFIAAKEANAVESYKQDIVANSAEGIVYTNLFTGVHGNYLKSSIIRAGLDPENLPESDPSKMNFGSNRPAKAWKDIWGSGQGIGAVKAVETVAEQVDRLEREYRAGRAALNGPDQSRAARG